MRWHDTRYGPGRPIQLLANSMTAGYITCVFSVQIGTENKVKCARTIYYYKDVTRFNKRR